MRRAIHTLRMRAGFLRKAPRGPSLDSQPTDETEIREHDRAADLLEALASPPETVEELRERVAKIGCIGVSTGPSPTDPIHVSTPYGPMDFGTGEKALRAAWFAIVGMMGGGAWVSNGRPATMGT